MSLLLLVFSQCALMHTLCVCVSLFLSLWVMHTHHSKSSAVSMYYDHTYLFFKVFSYSFSYFSLHNSLVRKKGKEAPFSLH